MTTTTTITTIPPTMLPHAQYRDKEYFYGRLRRVLLGLAHLFPDVGYCQVSIIDDIDCENHIVARIIILIMMSKLLVGHGYVYF